MKVLLDTQAFLWIISDAPELSKKAKKIFLDQENDHFLSLASILEMAIKSSLGKLKLKQPIEKFLPAQLQENSILQLDISFRHVVGVTSLPFHHRDPFDRLIISQAIQENLPILSCDEVFDAYNIQRLW
jgi:PIN domain nuclease of toxin-antitoxin system